MTISIVSKVANVGAGTGLVFRDENAQGQFNLKTVNAGDNIAITDNANDITIALTASSAKTVKVIALVDAATILVDVSLGNLFTVTLGDNRTLGNPSGPADGQMIVFRITQDGTGGRTLAYDTKYRFSTDIPSPTLSTAIGAIDYLGFIYHETDDTWDCIEKVFGF